MTQAASHERDNGDIDISVAPEDRAELEDKGTLNGQPVGPEASVDEDNLDHPEELMGE